MFQSVLFACQPASLRVQEVGESSNVSLVPSSECRTNLTFDAFHVFHVPYPLPFWWSHPRIVYCEGLC